MMVRRLWEHFSQHHDEPGPYCKYCVIITITIITLLFNVCRRALLNISLYLRILRLLCHYKLPYLSLASPHHR